MRSQPSRYSPLSAATFLLLLAACGGETARPGQASERAGALTSAALVAEAGAISGTNSDGVTVISSRNSRAASTRPVFQRRASPTAEVMTPPTAPGTPAARDTTDVQSGEETDSNPSAEHENDADPDGDSHTEDDDSQAEDKEPQLSARERMLAWLADDAFGENLPAAAAPCPGLCRRRSPSSSSVPMP